MNTLRAPLTALLCCTSLNAALPITEVTVFKDGHAMVTHVGTMPVDRHGNVVLGDLPKPILGTFWAFEQTNRAQLSSVRAGEREVATDAAAANLHEWMKLAVGTDVTLHLADGAIVHGKLLHTDAATAIVHGESIGIVNLADVRRAECHDPAVLDRTIRRTEPADELTFHLTWDEGRAAAEADIGMIYIQKGLRWIPSYRVTLLDDTRALIELSATIVNELQDLHDVRANLVIGVPTFKFEHTRDPMGLQEQIAALGPPMSRTAAHSGQYMSHAIMTQVAGARRGDIAQPSPSDVTVDDSAPTEDLYIFSLSGITLARGERLFVPLAASEVSYEAIYSLSLPLAPLSEMYGNLGTEQKRQLARQAGRSAAQHIVRITNSSPHPFTTAPALIIRDGQPLAQSMMTYTSRTGMTDLTVTSAVDIEVTRRESETDRLINGLRWNGHDYVRVDLAGTLKLTNRKTYPVTIEVRGSFLGNATEASHDGRVTGIDFLSGVNWDDPALQWSHWYGWPWWWSRLNGASQIAWDVTIEPGATTELSWARHYFWR